MSGVFVRVDKELRTARAHLIRCRNSGDSRITWWYQEIDRLLDLRLKLKDQNGLGM